MLISRKEAKDRGLTRYFTGVACKVGHVCERYASTGHCVECDKTGRALYRENNRQMIREKGAAYRKMKKAKAAAFAITIASMERPKAKPIPAPDWNAIGCSVASIQQRAMYYRDAYRKRRMAG